MTGRFSAPVAEALREAGWFEGRRLDDAALAAIRRGVGEYRGPFGGVPDDQLKATAAIAEFAGLAVGTRRPGDDLNPRPFSIDPVAAAASMTSIIDAGRILETGLYPLGVEGLHEAVLAINYLGQVFAIDPVGEWLLGESIDAALETLVLGRAPLRVPDNGRWPGRRWVGRGEGPSNDPVGLGALKRPIGAAFYLPRSPANLPYVWLPDTLVRIGTLPRAGIDPDQIEVEWGGMQCEAHVLDLAEFTVLVLAFESRDFVEQKLEVARTGGEDPGASPLAQAFRNACILLGHELEVAFVQTWQANDLLALVAQFEEAVLTMDASPLVNEGFGLLYLRSPLDQQVAGRLAEGHDELPIPGGRLVFDGTGPQRW